MATNLRDAAILQDFSVWINDVGKIGMAPGFQPPDIQIETESFRGGGMDGEVEIPMGISKIEFEFDLHTWDDQVWTLLGYGPGSLDVPITFRGYTMTANGVEAGVVIETFSLIKSIKTAKVEAGKKVEMTVSLSANRYRHEIGGTTVCDIDLFNKITEIGGTDRTANARKFIGLSY